MRSPYQYILMDLDGTLSDPGTGITEAVAYALQHFHITIEDKTILYPFIGPPLKESFMKYYHLSELQTQEAITLYRKYYSEKGLYQNALYKGTELLLQQLKTHNKTLMLATSKPTVYAEEILSHFHIRHFFSFIGGSQMNGTRTHKEEVIRFVLEQNHLWPSEEVIMVGDREYDVTGAQKAGIECIGVLYGYGSKEELQKAGAISLAETPEELCRILISGND